MDEKLWAEWVKIYDGLCKSEDYFEAVYFEHFCVGWCVAKGLGLSEALDFYDEAVKRGKF